MNGIKFIGTGRALPQKIVTNDDLSKIIDTNDEWIKTRTGISERRYCETETGLSLAADAAKKAIAMSRVSPSEIGVCIVLTVSPDYLAPTTACLLQRELSLPEDMIAFDMNVGCTGFLYGLHVMRSLLLQSEKKYGLIISAELLSRLTNFDDRSTCVLFGDGAAAAVISLSESAPYSYTAGCRGNKAITIVGPGKERPYIHMDGQEVFRFASNILPICIETLLKKENLTADDITWFIPHQANKRIIEAAARKLHLPSDRFYQNMQRYGNTSAASIPIAIDEMSEMGLLKRGDKIILAGFGAGLTWGGILIEW